MDIREINAALVARVREALPGWEVHTMDADLDRAVEQFKGAMEPWYLSADRKRIEDTHVTDLVEALLAAGWRPPEVAG